MMFIPVRFLKTIFVLGFFVIISTPAFSAERRVPLDYPTIQEGVDAAEGGDIVIVADGTYVENIRIEKSITIQSENGARHTSVLALNPNYHVFEIWADQVTIEGFTITGATGSSSSSGIYVVTGYHQCTLLNNQVGTAVSANTVGIFMVESNNSRLEGNTVQGNAGSGITIYRSTGNTLKGNTIIQNDGNGIYLSLLTESTLAENEIEQHTDHYGIFMHKSSNNRIFANHFSENYGGMEIRIDSTGNRISGNTFEGGRYNAIYMYSNSNGNIVSQNECTNYAHGTGIKIWASSGCEVSGNTISGMLYGIRFQTASDCLVSENSCTRNTFSGIEISFDSQGNQIHLNECSENDGSGIHIDNSSLNEVRLNIFSNNGEAGFSMDSAQENVLFQNRSSGNTMGASIEDSQDNRIFLNSFMDNGTSIFSQGSVTSWQDDQETAYVYQGTSYTGFLGNFYSDHDLSDSNGDGITNLPKDQPDIDADDTFPLAMAHSFFMIISPDMDADLDVDGLDAAGLASALAAGSGAADLNQDGFLDEADIRVFAEAFGK